MNSFEIIYEHTLKIGKLLLEDPSSDDFEEKVNVFANFMKQIGQVLSGKTDLSSEEMVKIKKLLDVNLKIEEILTAKRNMVREEITRHNRKGHIEKAYNKGSSLGYNKKS